MYDKHLRKFYLELRAIEQLARGPENMLVKRLARAFADYMRDDMGQEKIDALVNSPEDQRGGDNV